MVQLPLTHFVPEAAPQSASAPQAVGLSDLQAGGEVVPSQMNPKMHPFVEQSPLWQVPSGAQVSPEPQSLGWPQ